MDKQDVVVIGGGVIGLSIARELAIGGIQVLVIDKGPEPERASHGNAGVLAASHFQPLAAPSMLLEAIKSTLTNAGEISVRFSSDRDFIRWALSYLKHCRKKSYLKGMIALHRLCRKSLLMHKTLASLSDGAYGYRQSGLVGLFTSRKAFKKGCEAAGLLSGFGIEFEIFDRGRLSTVAPYLPFRAAGGIKYSGDALIDPAAFVKWLEKECLNLGVIFSPDTEVFDWKIGNKGIIKGALTTTGTVSCQRAVVAAGACSPHILKLLGIHIPVQPAKGYSITYREPLENLKTPIILEDVRVAATPFENRLRITGGFALGDMDKNISRNRVDRIIESAATIFPEIDQLHQVDIWRGIRPCSSHGLPIIEKAPGMQNLWVATGHGTKGMLLGPVTGKIIYALLSDSTPSN